METLVSGRYELLEEAIGETGQAIIDLEPGSKFDAQPLRDAAQACFDKGSRDDDAVEWHTARVEAQVGMGALQHLMVQRIMASPPEDERLFACSSGAFAVHRFLAGTTSIYMTPSLIMASQLNDSEHPLHQVRSFLLRTQNTIIEIESKPGFLKDGRRQVGSVERDPEGNMPLFLFADSFHYNTQQLINQVIVVRALAHAIGNKELPSAPDLHALIRSEIGELALLPGGVLHFHCEQMYGRDMAKEVRGAIRRSQGSREIIDMMARELNWEAAVGEFIMYGDKAAFDQCSVVSPLLQPELPKFDYRRLGRCFIRFPWRPRSEYSDEVCAYYHKNGVDMPADGSFSVSKFLSTHSNNVASQTIYLSNEYREALGAATDNIRKRQEQLQ